MSSTSKSLRTKTSSFGKHGRPAGRDGMSYPVGVAVAAKTWLLYLWEFFQQVAVLPGDLDDLIEKICPEQWLGHICQDKFVGEGDPREF